MNKVKVSTGLASLVLVASIFAGLGTMLTVIALLLLFCEVDNIKGVIVRVLSFYLGLLLFQTLWGILVDGYGVVCSTIDGFVNVINSYLDKPVTITKLHRYLLDPIKSILSICDNIVDFFVVIIKFGFVVSFLEGKVAKENFITKFVNKFVDKAVAFVNGIEG
jgi:hypothetical protein